MADYGEILVIRAAIEDVINQYATAVDSRDLERLEACFTPDATYVLDGSETRTYSGRAEIVRSIGRLFESSFTRTTHLMGRPQIELDETTARVTTAAIVGLAEEPGPAASFKLRGITYSDECVSEDGRWLIARRRHRALWMTTSVSEPPLPVMAPAFTAVGSAGGEPRAEAAT